MARVTTAEDLSALHLSSQGITFTPRPHSTQNRASLCGSRHRSIKSAAATPVSSVPDPTLFSWDIGQILLQKTDEKKDEVKEAFQMLDVGQTVTVTEGEFRRVIETFLFRLTEAEFDVLLAEGDMYTPETLNSLFEQEKDASVRLMRMQLNSHSRRTMTLSDLESRLKEKLCSAYQDIEKVSRAIDVSQSGFVSLDYLKSVINGFIFPLPNESFQELMNRLGLKATGKTAWQQFLKKSRDPGSTFKNRQTISMRNKHKVNPAKGGEAFSRDAVLQKLHSYIQDAYPSLKQAFLMLDKEVEIVPFYAARSS